MARPIEKRAHIERGVVEMVAAKGLRGTTIQDIAAAARVSPGLLYRYWKSRDDLAAEVYRAHFLGLAGRLSGAAAAETDVRHKLRAMVREFLRYADENPTQLKFLLLSQHDLAGCIPREMGVHALLRRVIDAGIAERRFRALDPDLLVYLVLGLVMQPAIGSVYGTLPGRLSDHLESIWFAMDRMITLERPGGTALDALTAWS